jgi:hypothetical protein
MAPTGMGETDLREKNPEAGKSRVRLSLKQDYFAPF